MSKIACDANIVLYRGRKFSVRPDVYESAEDTFLLADNLDVREGEQVLELGTGCGLLAILAAKAGARVVATDINPSAIECASANAAANGVSHLIDFRLGDLFDPVGDQRFDVVIFNPPYLPVGPKEALGTPLDRAWEGGDDGRAVIDRFLAGLDAHLKPKGRVLFVQSSLSNIQKTLNILAAIGFEAETRQEKLSFEELYLVSCSRAPKSR